MEGSLPPESAVRADGAAPVGAAGPAVHEITNGVSAVVHNLSAGTKTADTGIHVVVSNFPFPATDADWSEFFKGYDVQRIVILCDSQGQPLGGADVFLPSLADAQRAVDMLSGTMIQGKQIIVHLGHEWSDQSHRGVFVSSPGPRPRTQQMDSQQMDHTAHLGSDPMPSTAVLDRSVHDMTDNAKYEDFLPMAQQFLAEEEVVRAGRVVARAASPPVSKPFAMDTVHAVHANSQDSVPIANAHMNDFDREMTQRTRLEQFTPGVLRRSNEVPLPTFAAAPSNPIPPPEDKYAYARKRGWASEFEDDSMGRASARFPHYVPPVKRVKQDPANEREASTEREPGRLEPGEIDERTPGPATRSRSATPADGSAHDVPMHPARLALLNLGQYSFGSGGNGPQSDASGSAYPLVPPVPTGTNGVPVGVRFPNPAARSRSVATNDSSVQILTEAPAIFNESNRSMTRLQTSMPVATTQEARDKTAREKTARDARAKNRARKRGNPSSIDGELRAFTSDLIARPGMKSRDVVNAMRQVTQELERKYFPGLL